MWLISYFEYTYTLFFPEIYNKKKGIFTVSCKKRNQNTNEIKGTYGEAEETIDQIWYSSVNVGTDYKGFAYGQHYD